MNPINPLDFVLKATKREKGWYIEVDGEYLNVFRKRKLGTALARTCLLQALKSRYGSPLHLKITEASSGARLEEPVRRQGQVLRERREARRMGLDWGPPHQGDTITNPVVVIGNTDE